MTFVTGIIAVYCIFHCFYADIAAQPVSLELEVKDLVNGLSSPQTSIDGSVATRTIPLPPDAIFEFACIPSESIPLNPFVYLNSSGQFDKVEETMSEPTNPGVFVYKDGSNWKLKVINFTTELGGIYECRDGDLKQSFELVENNPGVIAEYLEQTLIEGTPGAVVNILLTGNPLPNASEIVYYYNGIELTEEKISGFGFQLFQNKQRIVITTVSYKHEGVYTIVLTTSAGTYNTSFIIHVAGLPVPIMTPPSSPVYLDEEFYITCNNTGGRPEPEIAWSLGDMDIVSGEDGFEITNYTNGSVLYVNKASLAHKGEYKCIATNVAGSSNSRGSVDIKLPTPPVPSITVNPTVPHAGTTVTIHCSTPLLHSAYEGKRVELVWKKSGTTITNSSRVSIESGFVADKLYKSILSLSPASGSIDSDLYSCVITVFDDYITSDTVTAEKHITINFPSIDITLSPESATVLDFSPRNTVSLTCNASTVNVSVDTHYTWSRDGVDITESNATDITEENGISILRLAPTVAGSYQYTCQFIVLLPNPDLQVINSVTATVIVQGPTPPNIPVQPVARPTSYNAVNIMFSVDNIVYDIEEYYVIYGLSSDNLAYESSKISGNAELDSLDEDFVIPLFHLEHNAVYYYRVVAINSHGMTQSAVNTFQTPRVVLTQYKASPFQGCESGRVTDSSNVKNFFNEKLSERLSVRCDCSFPRENLVNGTLHCTALSNTLIYRVFIIPTDEVTSTNIEIYMEESLKADSTFQSGVAEISVDTTCNISIASLTEPFCTNNPILMQPVEECNTSLLNIDMSTLILIAVIAGVFFILLVVTITVMAFMLVLQHKRLKRMGVKRTSNQYSVVNCKRETSFIDHHKRSPPSINLPGPPPVTAKQWEGDVSISDCPAYLYSVKPIEDEPPQTFVERQPTPGIYDSIDGLNVTNIIQVPNPLTTVVNEDPDDYTGSSSADFS